ncbi:hypothetical protein JCM10207_005931 [Rhodosporidiobolus poonsookiae]
MATYTPSLEPCRICGTQTSQRCSACSPHGVNLYFCSKEHQKLVWPIHKQFCGDNAHPFLWPGLTPLEASIAKQALDVRDGPDPMSTLRAELAREGVRVRRGEEESFFATLTPGAANLDTPTSQFCLHAVRNRLSIVIPASQLTNPGPAFGNIAQVTVEEASVTCQDFPHDAATLRPLWWSVFQHRFVIFTYVFLKFKGRKFTPEAAKILGYTYGQLESLIDEHLQPSHPEPARIIRGSLRMCRFGQELVFGKWG